MGEFLAFRRMITPTIIQVVFWIGVAIAVVGGLITIVMGGMMPRGGGQVFGGLLIIVLGPLVVRVYCELLILLFRMNDTLSQIQTHLEEIRDSRPPTV